ncbi:MAG: hypothetical protein C0402_13145 [Thermodesulfovibrio sp.]|nr:hypothetical protein [Thermodesulfovibrio sp.]
MQKTKVEVKALLKPLCSSRGIALLMVLWVLMILMVIVLSFSYLTRTEALGTLAFRNAVIQKFLAEAGIQRAVMEVLYRNQNKSLPPVEGQEVWRLDASPHTVQTENGHYTVSIIDESGKVDINKTPELLLKNILLNRGLKEEDADIIVDSIQDWRDPDDLHRLHGAESDYYMSLKSPYKARNADFETMEELLLVKGVTGELLYGGGGRGLIDILTVNGKSGKINLNAAPREVLLAIPGMTAELADALITNRSAQPSLGAQEILGGVYAAVSKYADALETQVFTVEAFGYQGTDKAGFGIRATIMLEANNKIKYLYYKSPLTGMEAGNADDL